MYKVGRCDNMGKWVEIIINIMVGTVALVIVGSMALATFFIAEEAKKERMGRKRDGRERTIK